MIDKFLTVIISCFKSIVKIYGIHKRRYNHIYYYRHNYILTTIPNREKHQFFSAFTGMDCKKLKKIIANLNLALT